MIDYLSSPGLGGGGEPRHRTLPGVLQGSVPGVRAAARRRALHPGATLALRALAGAKLLRQLLVVLIWANDRKMKLGDSYVQYFWFQHFFCFVQLVSFNCSQPFNPTNILRWSYLHNACK